MRPIILSFCFALASAAITLPAAAQVAPAVPAAAQTAPGAAATTATAAPAQWSGYDGLPWGSKREAIATRYPRLMFTNEPNDTFSDSWQLYESYQNSPIEMRIFVLANQAEQALAQVIVHYVKGQTDVQALVQLLSQRFGAQPKVGSFEEESYVDGSLEKVTTYGWTKNDTLIQVNHNQVTKALAAYYTSKAAFNKQGNADTPAWKP